MRTGGDAVKDLLDRLPLVVASEIDRDAKLRWLNRAAVTANGCTPADVVGLLVTDVWPDVAQAEPLWRAAWDTGVEQHITQAVRLLDGSTRWLSTTFAPRPDGRLVAVSVDIDEAEAQRRLAMLEAAPAPMIQGAMAKDAAAVRTAALGVLLDAGLTAEPARATPASRRAAKLIKRHGRAAPILRALHIEPDELAALCVRVMRSRR